MNIISLTQEEFTENVDFAFKLASKGHSLKINLVLGTMSDRPHLRLRYHLGLYLKNNGRFFGSVQYFHSILPVFQKLLR